MSTIGNVKQISQYYAVVSSMTVLETFATCEEATEYMQRINSPRANLRIIAQRCYNY